MKPRELVVDFSEAIGNRLESDSNSKHLKEHVDAKRAKAAAEAGEEATFDFRSENRVVTDLRAVLKQWEVASYRSDKDRWKSYATDVTYILSKYENTIDHRSIMSDLKKALNAWEHANYSSDKGRWESYAGDISSLISKHGTIA
tara:strand:- start:575 stop:1006 length:432 start_codon:yes stop_codon:yes gene_type:complete